MPPSLNIAASTPRMCTGPIPGTEEQPNFLIDFVEKPVKAAKSIATAGKYLSRGTRIYSGHQAFRQFDMVSGVPALNKSGNLRGMVVNAQARSAFNLAVKFESTAKNLSTGLLLAAWVIEIAKVGPEIWDVWETPGDPLIKIQKTSAQLTMATVRTLTGVIPSGTHVAAVALKNVLEHTGAPQAWSEKVQSFDVAVSRTYTDLTDAEKFRHFINTSLVVR